MILFNLGHPRPSNSSAPPSHPASSTHQTPTAGTGCAAGAAGGWGEAGRGGEMGGDHIVGRGTRAFDEWVGWSVKRGGGPAARRAGLLEHPTAPLSPHSLLTHLAGARAPGSVQHARARAHKQRPPSPVPHTAPPHPTPPHPAPPLPPPPPPLCPPSPMPDFSPTAAAELGVPGSPRTQAEREAQWGPYIQRMQQRSGEG